MGYEASCGFALCESSEGATVARDMTERRALIEDAYDTAL
jgi:hypothetical protein